MREVTEKAAGLTTPPPDQRPEFTSADTEAAERAWWQTYSELEDRFAWVQTPAVQTIIRGHYIREIIRATPRGGRILELGCGTGWLCRKLAQFGAREVWGTDFSPAQIALATSQARAMGLADRVHFVCASGSEGIPATEKFDCVVVHAFLHHLDKSEVDNVLSRIPGMLNPEGVLLVFEPIRDDASQDWAPRWEIRQRRLADLARRGGISYGLRRESAEEARWRAMFAARSVGQPPHGPSPKEMPFAPGALEQALQKYFKIVSQRDCMAMSHLVVQEWLLRGISHPLSTRLLLPIVARMAAWMDRRMLARAQFSPGIWKFTMYLCKAAQPAPR